MITKEKMQEIEKIAKNYELNKEILIKIENLGEEYGIQVRIKGLSLFHSFSKKSKENDDSIYYSNRIYDLVKLLLFIKDSLGEITISDSGSYKKKVKFDYRLFDSTKLYSYLNKQLANEIDVMLYKYGIERTGILEFNDDELKKIFFKESVLSKIKKETISQEMGMYSTVLLHHFEQSDPNFVMTDSYKENLTPPMLEYLPCFFENNVSEMNITSKYKFIWDLLCISGLHSYDNSVDKYDQVKGWVKSYNIRIEKVKKLISKAYPFLNRGTMQSNPLAL